MRKLTPGFFLAVLTLFLVGCAGRPLPKYQKPIARTRFQSVRTTAYTHTEDDHVQYSNRNALGSCLKCGPIHSAAADWSRWPAGTIFRIQETGEIFQVDDYGWALAGTNTIDLYKPSRSAMNAWGVRRVTIENLQWGDPRRSLAILRPRAKYRHIRRMVDEMENRMAELERPVEGGSTVIATATTPVVPREVVTQPPAPSRQPVISGHVGVVVSSGRPGTQLNPFFGSTSTR
ncbi:MAG: 3D domain-containing protein [Chthoniobacter sp.]|nr:3D domain-containing protein [Chthoniobacter sp.]